VTFRRAVAHGLYRRAESSHAFQPFGQQLKVFRAHIEHYSPFLDIRTLQNSIRSEYPNCSFILSMPLACLLESVTTPPAETRRLS
jgi:hypothetical protein